MSEIAKVGFGTWDVKPNEATEVVLNALNNGYTHIDCALLYNNETQIGQAFKEYFTTHDRKKYFITTKLWNTNHAPSNVKKQLVAQLKELQLDYVDLFIIHWPINAVHGVDPNPQNALGDTVVEHGYGLRDTWRAMEELVDSGLARFIGVSNFCVQLLQNKTFLQLVRGKHRVLEHHVGEILSRQPYQGRGVQTYRWAPDSTVLEEPDIGDDV